MDLVPDVQIKVHFVRYEEETPTPLRLYWNLVDAKISQINRRLYAFCLITRLVGFGFAL